VAKHITHWFSFFAISACVVLPSQAQLVMYLDQNFKPASPSSYTYKRVVTPGGSDNTKTLAPGGLGSLMPRAQTVWGAWHCSLVDYYKSGRIALTVNVVSLNALCSDGAGGPSFAFDGEAISYYPSGHISGKGFWHIGKLQGDAVDYNEDGTVRDSRYYEDGKLIEGKKFAVSPLDPLLGEWRRNQVAVPPKELTWVFHANGILDSIFFDNDFTVAYPPQTIKVNWKYIPVNSASGALESYQDNKVVWKGNIRWFNPNQFEYTCTIAPDPSYVGLHWTFTHQSGQNSPSR
jgi:hypothetical protein